MLIKTKYVNCITIKTCHLIRQTLLNIFDTSTLGFVIKIIYFNQNYNKIYNESLMIMREIGQD